MTHIETQLFHERVRYTTNEQSSYDHANQLKHMQLFITYFVF